MNNNNWKVIIFSALITGVIAVLSTLIVNHFTSKKTKFTYLTQTSIPFQKDSLNVKIYNLDLINNGDAIIENIHGLIDFNNQQITDYKLKSAPVISIKDSLVKNKYNIVIQSLNPAEKITMSFLVSSPNKTDTLPKVNFRANGLSAELESESKNSTVPLYQPLLIGITIAVSLSSILLTRISRNFSKKIDEAVNDDGKHTGDQSKILAYLCGVNGLPLYVSKYLDVKNDIEYWSEADYFGNISFLNKNDKENINRLNVLLDLLNYGNVAKKSTGIIYYNIAKIYKVMNDEDNFKEYIKRAQEIIPQIIAKRLEIEKDLLYS